MLHGTKLEICVSITQVLKKYCSQEDVWEQIIADGTKASDGEVLHEFMDEEYFKHHLFFSREFTSFTYSFI